ncbi:MAG: 3-dehydroquinate synthase, partial [Chlamydiia bacterium]|nr:3-dehydroquinate synthase [Chlamydiia bacterium]
MTSPLIHHFSECEPHLWLAEQLALEESPVAIICDETVQKLYGDSLELDLKVRGVASALFSFPAGEQNKSPETLCQLVDELSRRQWGRRCRVVGLGGGVTTDLAGLLASVYCRGVRYYAVPTTLLGMVDASIGGKTGVNLPSGKNLMGTFYCPECVWILPAFLRTLPLRERRQGIAEMIKHGLIASAVHFARLEKGGGELLADASLSYLSEAIRESTAIKMDYVNDDPFDRGRRSQLNFGHTIAHGIEAASNYQISHGEAVAIGIAVESYLSTKLGKLTEGDYQRICSLLLKFELPTKIPEGMSADHLIELMSSDKKKLSQG